LNSQPSPLRHATTKSRTKNSLNESLHVSQLNHVTTSSRHVTTSRHTSSRHHVTSRCQVITLLRRHVTRRYDTTFQAHAIYYPVPCRYPLAFPRNLLALPSASLANYAALSLRTLKPIFLSINSNSLCQYCYIHFIVFSPFTHSSYALADTLTILWTTTSKVRSGTLSSLRSYSVTPYSLVDSHCYSEAVGTSETSVHIYRTTRRHSTI
jgi:hypothetical protein